MRIDGGASSSEVAPIRSMYVQGSPISLWPNYLYIFNLAYSSALPFWIAWLQEEARLNPQWEQIQEIFLRYQKPGNEQANDGNKRHGLWHKRNEFLTRTLGQLDFLGSCCCCSLTCQSPMPYTHINAIFPDAPCDPPTASIPDELVITSLSHYAQLFQSHNPTKLLRDGGLVYDVLNEVSKYLRLNKDIQESLLRAIKLTVIELVNVCMTYLTL
jgi:hypothetical protein